MPDAVYLLGHEAGSTGNPGLAWETNPSYYDSQYSRSAIKLGVYDSQTFGLPALVEDSSGAGYWFHGRQVKSDSSSTSASSFARLVEILGDGYISSRVIVAGYKQTYLQLFQHNSSSYSQGAVNVDGYITTTAPLTIDLHVYTDGSGSHADLYLNSGLISSVSIAGDYNTGLRTAVIGAPWATTLAFSCWSEIVIANFDTRGLRVKTLAPSADGYHTEALGAYTDVDDVQPDLGGFLFTATGQRQTFQTPGLPSVSGIRAVALCARAASDGTNQLKSLVRIGGVDYLGGTVTVSPASLPSQVIYTEDPSTTSPWVSDLSAVEFGFQSVTP